MEVLQISLTLQQWGGGNAGPCPPPQGGKGTL